jgi:hypothetical protein
VSTQAALADYLSDYCLHGIVGLSRVGGQRFSTPGDPDMVADGVSYGPRVGAPYQ